MTRPSVPTVAFESARGVQPRRAALPKGAANASPASSPGPSQATSSTHTTPASSEPTSPKPSMLHWRSQRMIVDASKARFPSAEPDQPV